MKILLPKYFFVYLRDWNHITFSCCLNLKLLLPMYLVQKRSDKKALTWDYFIQLDKDLSKTLCNLCGEVFFGRHCLFFHDQTIFMKDCEFYTKGHSLLDPLLWFFCGDLRWKKIPVITNLSAVQTALKYKPQWKMG